MIHFFFIIKIKPPAQTCKMAAKWYNSSDTNSRVFYGVYNCSTVHNDHDIENVILKMKKTLEIEIWKIYRLQSSNGEKQADKRPISKQKLRTDCQKSLFFLVVWPPNGSLSPPKMLGTPKINSRNFLNNKISTFYCWLYFPTSIVHILDYLLTPERIARQQNV